MKRQSDYPLYTFTELAIKFGVTRQTISNYYKMMRSKKRSINGRPYVTTTQAETMGLAIKAHRILTKEMFNDLILLDENRTR